MRALSLLAAAVLLAAAPAATAKQSHSLDAFLAGPVERQLAVDASDMAAAGIRIAHTEPRLGVPSFVFADSERFPAAGGSAEQAARAHLQRLAALYRLTPAAIEQLPVRGVHERGAGAVIVSLGAAVGATDVFRHEIDVVMNAALELVAVSGYLPPSELVAAADATGFALGHEEAVAAAFREMTGAELASSLLLPGDADGGYRLFELPASVESLLGYGLVVPARARAVFFALPEKLVPAYYVELNVQGAAEAEAPYHAFVVDARDGTLLFRHDLTDHATYRVHADPFSFVPSDGPHGTEGTPHPTGLPDGYQAPFVAASDVTLASFPYSAGDPWLPIGATETRGNNVDAYADLVAPDGFQAGFDLRASATGPDAFLRSFTTGVAPGGTPDQIAAAVTNLFYTTNFLHDWFYDAGFDERAGNAQLLNYGRGGLQGDALRAEAQDHGGRNNANMSTPADGASPRMQMYVFDGEPQLQVTAPAGLAGMVGSNDGLGPTSVSVTAELHVPDPAGTTLGCAPFAANAFAGRIVLLDRGTCSFTSKGVNAQAAGAIGVVIANNVAGDAPGLGGYDPQLTIPVFPVSLATGNAWKSALLAAPASPIHLSMERGPHLDRDGSVDNDIVAHEWGHLISNRLIGDANGLTNLQGDALGEGWADFHALLLQVREWDRNLPGNHMFQGVYAIASYAEGGGRNNAAYYGMRRVPYTTDFSRNGLTLGHVANGAAAPAGQVARWNAAANSEVHNAGEVWATMLWECYASLLNAYPFAEAQDRMKQYLVAAYKATPVMPTFLEARDALLAVAAASDPADQMRFSSAFARRGAGYGAVAADRASQDFVGVRESFVAGNNLEVITAELVEASSGGCDRDGVLDVGEQGLVRIVVRNNGRGALASQSATVTEGSGTLAFPAGNVIYVPSLAPGQSATRTLPVSLPAGAVPAASLSIGLAFDEPSLPVAVRSFAFSAAVHHDVQLGVSTVDEMIGAPTAWAATQGAGWRSEGGTSFGHIADADVAGEASFTTPWIAVPATGNFVLDLRHRWSFETNRGGAPYYDGGVVEVSWDGVRWYDLYADLGVNPGYSAYLATGGGNPLEDRAALVGMSPGFPAWRNQSIQLGTLLAGRQVKFRFRVGTDVAVGAWGWDIDRVTVTGAANLPFGGTGVERSNGTVCNLRPVADAGRSRSVWEGGFDGAGAFVRSTVSLDGSGSFEPEGAALSYAWTQVAGSPVSLAGANAAVATFEPDVPGDEVLTFELLVSDGIEWSLPALVDIYVANVNRPPVASAFGPAVVAERSAASFVLDGSASADADGEPLSFAWSQVAGVPVALVGADAAAATVEVPEVAVDELLRFQLEVSDGIDVSAPVFVEVQVTNVDRAPVVDAGADGVVASRGSYVLAASGSDADGDALAFAWTQLAGPAVALGDAAAASTSFVAPSVAVATDLVFEVTATAGGVSVSDSVVVSVEAEPLPVVDAGADVAVPGRQTVVLRGTATVPGGAVPTLAWTQLQGTPVVLSGPDAAVASFTSPDVKSPETLVFQLEATAHGVSATDTVQIDVAADGAPVVDAGADVAVASREAVLLRAAASDPEGDAITFAWTQVAGTAVVLAEAQSASPQFVAPSVLADEVLVFEVVASANGLEARDEVAVSVAAEPVPVVDAGADQAVAGRTLVALRGSATGAEVLAWEQVEGPAVALDAAGAAATFVSPDVKEEATLVFRLVASAHGQSASDAVAVVVAADGAPVADAGAALDVQARAGVQLVGGASDPEGDALVVAWSQVGGPAVVLEGASTLAPRFVAPDVREMVELVFQLVATANGLESAPATVTVRVHPENRRPVVSGPNEIEVDERTPVTLEASGVDADGDAIAWRWEQTGGVAVELDGAATAAVSFVAPEVVVETALSFRLIAIDAAEAESEPATVRVLVRNVNRAPVAAAALVAGGAAGSTVVLDASASRDEDGGGLTFAWRQIEGTAVELVGAEAAVARFVAPGAAGTLRFEVTVTDAEGASAVAEVEVEIAAAARPAKKEESGCSAAGGSPAGGLLAFGALALLRRRRR